MGLAAWWASAACLLAVTVGAATEQVDAQHKVLVILEDLAVQHTHSQYWQSLRAAGFDLAFRAADDSSLNLQHYDDYLYSGVVVLGSSIQDFGGDVSGSSLLDFVDAGNSLVVITDQTASDELRELATDLGVDLEPKHSTVTDHFSHVLELAVDHTAVVSDNVVQSPAVLSPASKGPVIFKGIAATLSPDSELVAQALSASDTAYSASIAKTVPDVPAAAGKDLALVSLVQARNNARTVVAGSSAMFSNEYFQARTRDDQTAGNAAFCRDVTLWALKHKGVLKASPLRHNLKGSSEQPSQYRITDELEFAMDVQELQHGKWHPYNADDMQLEFTMLDPHVRTPLKHNNKGTFFTSFKVPDVYGVFKFVIDHKRLGYSWIEQSVQIPVRPFKHNEFERFLTPAYPYYASVFSVMAAFYILGFFFLYHR
jgi:oligosaccharyltransferase complex subunit beta